MTSSASFIRVYLIDEVKAMERARVKLHLLAAISHGIEVAGALMDDLPYKAKGHGRKRFELALRKLFPKPYAASLRELDLYGQLRSHLSHSMVPANTLSFTTQPQLHLEQHNDSVSICLAQLSADYFDAMERLHAMTTKNELPQKKVSWGNLEAFG